MAFDGITTKSIVSELNNKLIGAKINKVYQPNKLEIMLSAYNNGKIGFFYKRPILRIQIMTGNNLFLLSSQFLWLFHLFHRLSTIQ